MIFDSLGIGEFGVVMALAIVLIEPKKLGKVMKEFGKFKRKVSQIQSDVKSQIDSITREEDAKELNAKTQNDKAGMRKWAEVQVLGLPASIRSEASQALLEKIMAWPTYQQAKTVSCFAGTLNEIDTEALLTRILADGKTLVMPFIKRSGVPGSPKTMGMAPVADLKKDLAEGTLGIREPRKDLQEMTDVPKPDLIFVPGTCFDERGGRLGRGMGYYDRYLAQVKGFRAGICFDVQITQKNLALDAHDQFLDVLISEKRHLIFSAPSALMATR